MAKPSRQRKLLHHKVTGANIRINAATHAQGECSQAEKLLAKGEHLQALNAFEAVLRVNPNHASAIHGAALACYSLGRSDDACTLLRHATTLAPNNAEYHNNLGTVLAAKRQFEEAIVCHHRAVHLDPTFAQAHNNLGNALRAFGRADAALGCFDQALALNPNYAEAHLNRGNALRALRRTEDALESYHRAVVLAPLLAAAHDSLGTALKELGHWEAALAAYAEALKLAPNAASTHYNLGTAFYQLGRLDDARHALEFALTHAPNLAEAALNLGNVAKDQGRLDDALGNYQHALQLRPNYATAHSNLLFTLNYVDGITPAEILARHCEFNQRYAAEFASRIAPHLNIPDPEKRLKVAYISPDLRGHACAFFVEPLFTHHDRAAVEIFAYAEVANPDEVTARLRGLVDHWRSTVGLADDEVAALIRADGIDVVIDLAGHTARSRILALARKPAPVQASYLGYPATTGLEVMDYRITDAVTEPPGTSEHYYTETLIRLPHSLWCYQPFADMPAVTSLSALNNGYVTFGSFNNFAKVGARVIELWAGVLQALPRACLSMLCAADVPTQARVITQFAAYGISAERLVLYGRESRTAYLQRFAAVDIALDPFPCNGGTTTCDALWMGLPVVTLIGDTFLSRASYSVLSAAGLSEFATPSAADYIAKCVALASDLTQLQTLREGLRRQLQGSALLDGPLLARNMEAALREMWRMWCRGKTS